MAIICARRESSPEDCTCPKWLSILKAGFHTKARSGRTNQSCWAPATPLDMNMEPQKLIISGIAFRVTPALPGSMSICHNNSKRRELGSPSAYDPPPSPRMRSFACFDTEEASRQNHGPFLRPLHKGKQHKTGGLSAALRPTWHPKEHQHWGFPKKPRSCSPLSPEG